MRKLFVIPILLILSGCTPGPPRPMNEYTGYTEGTTFHITYDKGAAGDLKPEIDQLLDEISRSLSLYDPTSLICRVNRTDSLIAADRHFVSVFEISQKIYGETGGAYNPAIYPMVKFWGFGVGDNTAYDAVDSAAVDSLRPFVRFDDVQIVQQGSATYIRKKRPGIQLDFNAIIKGYTVDQLSALLDSKGIANYMIEVGGETSAKGKDAKGEAWMIGIDKPIEDPNDRELVAIARISNSSIASSGSYRKYYVKDGMKYSHTIDPSTGYPVSHTLVSASVFGPTCAEADAYATAFMVMGVERSKKFVEKHPSLSIYLIYTNYKGEWETYISEGLKERLEVVKKK